MAKYKATLLIKTVIEYDSELENVEETKEEIELMSLDKLFNLMDNEKATQSTLIDVDNIKKI